MDFVILVIGIIMIIVGFMFLVDALPYQKTTIRCSIISLILGILGIIWIIISTVCSKEVILNTYPVKMDESKTFQYIVLQDTSLINVTSRFGKILPDEIKIENFDYNGWSYGIYRTLSTSSLRIKKDE